LQEIFAILYTGMPYNSLIVYKSILQIEIIVLEVLFLDFFQDNILGLDIIKIIV
jgi:hypothetical protein